MYPILPISDFKTVAQTSSPAQNLMMRMALGGCVKSRGGDPGAAVHGTQETSADMDAQLVGLSRGLGLSRAGQAFSGASGALGVC